MKVFLLILIFIFTISILHAQKNLETEVIVLNTCSPNSISIQRDSSNIKIRSANKLSMNANHFSAFKITNINPLRYSYTIKNELVSRFFDNSDIEISNFKKDTASVSAGDIKILQLFGSDTARIRQNDELKKSKETISLYKDSVNHLAYNIQALTVKIKDLNLNYDIIIDTIKTTKNTHVSKEYVVKLNTEKDSLNLVYVTISQKLKDELENYRSIIASLTINNGAQELLENIINIESEALPKILQSAAAHIKCIADLTKKEIADLDTLLNYIPSVSAAIRDTNVVISTFMFNNGLMQNHYSNINNMMQRLKSQIAIVKRFAADKSFTIQTDIARFSPLEQRIQLYSLEEFAAKERLRLAQIFVTMVSLELGKLLQNEIEDCSRFQNDLNISACIMDTLNISKNKKEATAVFNYIQNVCADLNIFIKSLNPAFYSTVKNINDNYRELLKYLKTFDFISNNTTERFTLPTHSNLKNVDIIRYSIERKDRLNGSIEPYDYDIWLKGGLKIDFSVAILLSQLTDFTFSKDALFSAPVLDSATGNYNSTARSDSFYIRKVNSGSYDFAFGGMVNIMVRTGASWVTPGASLGIAYGTSTNSKLQFLGALSLQFGKSERVIAHFGVVAGQAQRLDISQLNYKPEHALENGNYEVQGNFNTATIPLNYKFTFKPFFGISYNLSKKNALNAVGSGADKFNSSFPK